MKKFKFLAVAVIAAAVAAGTAACSWNAWSGLFGGRGAKGTAGARVEQPLTDGDTAAWSAALAKLTNFTEAQALTIEPASGASSVLPISLTLKGDTRSDGKSLLVRQDTNGSGETPDIVYADYSGGAYVNGPALGIGGVSYYSAASIMSYSGAGDYGISSVYDLFVSPSGAFSAFGLTTSDLSMFYSKGNGTYGLDLSAISPALIAKANALLAAYGLPSSGVALQSVNFQITNGTLMNIQVSATATMDLAALTGMAALSGEIPVCMNASFTFYNYGTTAEIVKPAWVANYQASPSGN